MDSMLGKLGLEQGESITHPWVTKAIERAQGKVEARNFDIRKNILKYDDVMNDQRKVIFEQRLEMMDAEDVSDTVKDMRHDVVDAIIAKAIPAALLSRAVEYRPARSRRQDLSQRRRAGEGLGRGRGHRRRGDRRERLLKVADEAGRRQGRQIFAPTSCARWKNPSCCNRSTGCGASTW